MSMLDAIALSSSGDSPSTTTEARVSSATGPENAAGFALTLKRLAPPKEETRQVNFSPANIKALKEKVRQEFGSANFRIIFSGRLLNGLSDDTTLSSQGIKPNVTIVLVPGGGNESSTDSVQRKVSGAYAEEEDYDDDFTVRPSTIAMTTGRQHLAPSPVQKPRQNPFFKSQPNEILGLAVKLVNDSQARQDLVKKHAKAEHLAKYVLDNDLLARCLSGEKLPQLDKELMES